MDRAINALSLIARAVLQSINVKFVVIINIQLMMVLSVLRMKYLDANNMMIKIKVNALNVTTSIDLIILLSLIVNRVKIISVKNVQLMTKHAQLVCQVMVFLMVILMEHALVVL